MFGCRHAQEQAYKLDLFISEYMLTEPAYKLTCQFSAATKYVFRVGLIHIVVEVAVILA